MSSLFHSNLTRFTLSFFFPSSVPHPLSSLSLLFSVLLPPSAESPGDLGAITFRSLGPTIPSDPGWEEWDSKGGLRFWGLCCFHHFGSTSFDKTWDKFGWWITPCTVIKAPQTPCSNRGFGRCGPTTTTSTEVSVWWSNVLSLLASERRDLIYLLRLLLERYNYQPQRYFLMNSDHATIGSGQNARFTQLASGRTVHFVSH